MVATIIKVVQIKSLGSKSDETCTFHGSILVQGLKTVTDMM